MTWRPATHSATTDYVATAVVFDEDHQPLAFKLDDRDLAHAAAARHHLRAHVERLNTLQPVKRKKKREK